MMTVSSWGIKSSSLNSPIGEAKTLVLLSSPYLPLSSRSSFFIASKIFFGSEENFGGDKKRTSGTQRQIRGRQENQSFCFPDRRIQRRGFDSPGRNGHHFDSRRLRQAAETLGLPDAETRRQRNDRHHHARRGRGGTFPVRLHPRQRFILYNSGQGFSIPCL